jgi:hypothetical protein
MDQQELFEQGHILTPEEVIRIETRKQTAIQAAQKTPGTQTKHLQLSIAFQITIAGTPPNDDGMNEPDPVYHARQARLLAAAKNNPEVLKRWMRSLIANQMQQKDGAYWEDVLVGGDIAYQDLLAPALAALPEDDQEFFALIPKGVYFDEMIDLFSASFSISGGAPTVQESE